MGKKLLPGEARVRGRPAERRRFPGLKDGITMCVKRLTAALLCLLMTLSAACALAQPAVIDNGGDLSARLNLRVQPDANAAVLGRFYTGTPVEVLFDAGNGWSCVSVGCGRGYVEGYARSESLSDSGGRDATWMMTVASPYGTLSVVLRDSPSNSYSAVTMLAVGTLVRVIGTAGDYLYVQLDDGSVGCLAQDEVR